MVEIAKALAHDPKILILDEATSALTSADVASVFNVLRTLREQGLAIVYISHRMHEIAELADDCSVYRNGRHVATFPAGSKTSNEIVELMIGREYSSVFPARPLERASAPPVLEVRKLSWAGRLRDIDLELRPGEIVGLGGLDGQGQRDLLLALFGALTDVGGSVVVNGRSISLSSPRRTQLVGGGIALIPEDRKSEGVMLPMSVSDNLSFAAIGQFTRFGLIDAKAERAAVERMIELLQIRSGGIDAKVSSLSGGNQQKVVIGKWLMTNPQIILLSDPTRGIDVGTKQELYRLMRKLADANVAILFYSTDYDELIGCCDRVLILYDGAIVRALEGAALNEHNIVASSHNLPIDGGAAAS
jgi:ribose transport system ATP-binding protein